MRKRRRSSQHVVAQRGLASAQKRAAILALKAKGLTITEIGRELNMPPSTVSHHWRLGMRSLHDSIKVDAEAIFAQEHGRLEAQLAHTFKVQKRLEKLVKKLAPYVLADRTRTVVTGFGTDGKPIKEIQEYRAVDARVADQYRMTLEALAALVPDRIKIAERLAKMVGLDKEKWESRATGSLGTDTSPFMEVLVRVWDEKKKADAAAAAARQTALPPAPITIDGVAETIESPEEKIQRILREGANGHGSEHGS
jgi:DNA-binding CsgD family transcriptional regulator